MTVQLSLHILRLLIVISIPFLLVALSARLVMTPPFLQFEYTRPGFPVDPYGLTTDDRLTYAPHALDYLIYAQDISSLEQLNFPDGIPLFNARELRHMVDVQILTQAVFTAAFALAAFLAILTILLWRTPHIRMINRALFEGGLLTIGLIALIVIFALASWDTFFTGFHAAFFENDTWYFAYSDTLIRLFPEQFWFDAALAVGLLTVTGASSLIFVTWQAGRSAMFTRRALTS